MTRPQHVSRDTRRLLIAAAVAVICLWALARLRFPETPVAANPVPPLLAQLAPPTRFADLASEIEALTSSLDPLLPRVRLPDADDTWHVALQIRPRLAAIITPADRSAIAPGDTTRVDRPTGLVLLATAETGRSIPRPPTPLDLTAGRFLFIAAADGQSLTLRPVFMPRTQPHESRAWEGNVWPVDAGTGLRPGELVFTATGELVGAVAGGNAGATFMIPVATLVAAIDRLAAASPDQGSGWLGIRTASLTTAVAQIAGVERGAIVVGVEPDGPAAHLVAPGEIIATVNDTAVGDASDWAVAIGRLRPGEAVKLRVLHRRGDRDVALTAAAPPAAEHTRLGLHVQPTRDGAIVLAVDAGTAAARVLQAGDLITQVDDLRLPSSRQMQQAFDTAAGGILVLFTRNGVPRAVALER